MKRTAFLAALFPLLMLGCKHGSAAGSVPASASTPVKPAPETSHAVARTPIVKGYAYQLSLKDGVLGFCDDTGSQQMSVSTGNQTPGTQTCNRKTVDTLSGVTQERCDSKMEVTGPQGGGNDRVSLKIHDYELKGHFRTCDEDGSMYVIGSGGAVEVIDDAANKVATIDSGGAPAVIDAGWVAWTTADKENGIRLVTVDSVMKNSVTPP